MPLVDSPTGITAGQKSQCVISLENHPPSAHPEKLRAGGKPRLGGCSSNSIKSSTSLHPPGSQGGYVIICICLLVSRIMQKLQYAKPVNLVEGSRMGEGRTHCSGSRLGGKMKDFFFITFIEKGHFLDIWVDFSE